MDQSEISELISAYLDGEATPAEREEVERLLETSPHWRSKLDQFSRLSELLRDAPRHIAPPELAAAVQARLVQMPKAQLAAVPARSLRREWLAALAGMAVTLLGGFVALQVMNLNRAAHEHFALTQQDVTVLSEAASSRSQLGIEAKPPTSATLAFSAPERKASETEMFFEEQRVPSLAASSRRAKWNDANGSQPAQGDAALQQAADDYSARLFAEEKEEIQPKDQLRIGDVLTVFEHMDGVVFVVELAVVDMNEAGGQLELLLAKNGLNILPEGVADRSMVADGTAADKREAKESGKDAAASYDASPLKLMYVTAPRVTIAQVLDELGRQQVVAQARLQPPVPAAPMEDMEKLAERVEEVADQPVTPEQSQEAALLNEAVVVGQNYSYSQQQVMPPASKPVPESLARKQADFKATEQRFRIVDAESKMKRRSGLADQKSQDAREETAQTENFSKNSPTQLYLSNSAVPMTLNPQTGEVTNQLNSANFGTSLAKKSLRNFDAKTGPVASKSRYLDDSAKRDESAPADAAVAAGTELGDQDAEPPIRVLFVVKQADAGVSP